MNYPVNTIQFAKIAYLRGLIILGFLFSFSTISGFAQTKNELLNEIATEYASYDYYLDEETLTTLKASKVFEHILNNRELECLNNGSISPEKFNIPSLRKNLFDATAKNTQSQWPKDFVKRINKRKKRKRTAQTIRISEPIVFSQTAFLYIDSGSSVEMRTYKYENGLWHYLCYVLIE